jgi:Sulfotransferase family
MQRDGLEELLEAASDEHEQSRELLEATGGSRASTSATSQEAAVVDMASGAAGALEERLVWIFGSPRSGSSWLMRLLAARKELATINESYLGAHLVPIGGTVEAGEYYEHGERAEDASYFFARAYIPVLRPMLRGLILHGLQNQLRQMKLSSRTLVVIKEPNGSHAADTIVSLLPATRMIFLLRDGRDVIDSLVDAMLNEESWWAERRGSADTPRASPGRVAFISQHSALWVHRTIATQRAFASLPEERRLLVRYEELLADTPAQLGRIYDWLGLDVSGRDVEAIASRLAYNSVPKDRRGPGKDIRAASPGLWRENLTEDEQEAMHEVMGVKLRELGYET